MMPYIIEKRFSYTVQLLLFQKFPFMVILKILNTKYIFVYTIFNNFNCYYNEKLDCTIF